ncbi:MAG: hypothetical protein ACK5L5_03130 [Bacteroidales bacterium]
MGIEKYVSKIRPINSNVNNVYAHLSNLENLSRYFSGEVTDKINKEIPQVQITNVRSDYDSIKVNITGLGETGLNVIERESSKLIKLATADNFPLPIIVWIQLLPVSEQESKIRLTVHMTMNMMAKMAIGKKMKKGVDKMVETLSLMTYR